MSSDAKTGGAVTGLNPSEIRGMLSQPCRNVQRGFQALCVRSDPAQPGAELPLEQHGGDDALASRNDGEVAGGGGVLQDV